MIFATRLIRTAACLALAGVALAGCREAERGPVRISAIGGTPVLTDANRAAIEPGSALLLDAVAQGLVRFDAAGEIEPALAQSWIVSDDGRRYTFRLRRTLWTRGEKVTARQVVARLQAAIARNSRNSLKPVLGAIEQTEAMTDQVLEIRLKAPRPHFLQLLAQPEMAILANDEGTGPYRIGDTVDGVIRLIPPPADEDEVPDGRVAPDILLRGDEAAVAIARFVQGDTDLVTGGTLGDLPLLAGVRLPADRIVHDPARGLFGLAFARTNGRLGDPRFRHALAMAVDRDAIQARFDLGTFGARTGLLPAGLSELPNPSAPDWSTLSFAERQQIAARIIADQPAEDRPRLRIAIGSAPGHRILLAHLRRDWRAVGIEAVGVAPDAEADLRLIDSVAPADLVSWYLRHFTCSVSALCNAEADTLLEEARNTQAVGERQALLQRAERALVGLGIFIAIAQPVRWSLRDERLNGFRPNSFARHSPTELIARED